MSCLFNNLEKDPMRRIGVYPSELAQTRVPVVVAHDASATVLDVVKRPVDVVGN
jgi:hypothetical protein